MAGVAFPNIPTYHDNGTDVTAREGEHTAIGENATPFTDTTGDGSYNSYLGCNRAGSCAAGIGINTGDTDTTTESWSTLDQAGAARTPQDSGYIANTGYVNRSSTDWPSSGGTEGLGTDPITHIQYPATPGTVDVNDTANFLAATQQAAPDAVVDVGTGAVNKTGRTVEIGERGWFPVPVA